MISISSLVPGLLLRVRQLREAIAAGGTPTRSVADLTAELDVKLPLLESLLAAATPVKRKSKDRASHGAG
jgi:hypothetical protein